MAYVDLNPIRAGKAKSLEKSPFTSIKRRIKKSSVKTATFLLPFRQSFTALNLHPILSLSLDKYIKHLYAAINLKPDSPEITIIDDYVKDENNWIENSNNFETNFSICAGEAQLVESFEKQARFFTNIHRKEKRALADTILARLLYDQYLNDNKALSN